MVLQMRQKAAVQRNKTMGHFEIPWGLGSSCILISLKSSESIFSFSSCTLSFSSLNQELFILLLTSWMRRGAR